MFQFSSRFAFINFSSFKPDTENNANFEAVSILTSAYATVLRPSVVCLWRMYCG